MRLSDLKTHEKGVIVKVMGHGGFRKRIVEMGFIKGKTVEVLLNAPLKDPIKYKVMGYEISLRRKEAAMIEVISEEEAKLLSKDNEIHHAIIDDSEAHIHLEKLAMDKRKTIRVALVGNPNCGKTSLFNIASGAHEHVGNYSGVTVDAKVGTFNFQGYHFELIDLPGTYSLSAYSPEEIYVRKHIIDETPDIIINVVDSSNLERNLYLTTQLIDMNVRMVVALNMYDELDRSGNKLDYIKLMRLLGVPMVPTVSRTGQGIDQLFHVIISLYEGSDYLLKDNVDKSEVIQELRSWHNKYVKDHVFGAEEDLDLHRRSIQRHIHINHGPELEQSIDRIKKLVAINDEIRYKYSTRFIAIKLLEDDKEMEKVVAKLPNADEIFNARAEEKSRISASLGEDSEQAVTDAKYAFIAGALKETYTDNHKESNKWTHWIDSIVTHKIWGFPVFFLFMFIMFEFTFIIGAYPQGWIESGVAWLASIIENNMAPGSFKDLLIDGIIGGVGGVIVFLPNILLLYLFISIMEDTGYMARAAFIMDKVMHKMGLHGKSFIPLVMGFGCNVPSIMATRMIENRKSRLITMLVNPLMSCSARLPIYLLLVGTFFPHSPGLAIFSIYVLGIVLAVVLAQLFSKFLVKGDDTPFVMELPPYRIPTAKAIYRHTWEKGVQYLKKMGGIIMIASVVIWALGYFPHQEGESEQEQQENSYIGRIGKGIEPVIQPLGFDWKLGIGLLSGVAAKELVVSTLGVLYTNDKDADNTTLGARIPITPLVAYCYMIFTLIYFPCIATLVAIKQESGDWRWALFAAVYTTGLAWLLAYIIYRIGGLFI